MVCKVFKGCDVRSNGATLLEIHLLRFDGGFQLCAEHGPGARTSRNCARAGIFFFIVGLFKVITDCFSWSPEVKPAEAHSSDSVLCAEVVL